MSNQNFLQVIKSVFASFIGIQTEANRKNDFENNSPAAYIIAGLIMTVLFVLTIIIVVTLII